MALIDFNLSKQTSAKLKGIVPAFRRSRCISMHVGYRLVWAMGIENGSKDQPRASGNTNAYCQLFHNTL